MSRANAHPTTTSASTVAARTDVSKPGAEDLLAICVYEEDSASNSNQSTVRRRVPANRLLADLCGEADLLPSMTTRLEHWLAGPLAAVLKALPD